MDRQLPEGRRILPGTLPLEAGRDLAEAMVAGIGAWCDRETAGLAAGWTEHHDAAEIEARRAQVRVRVGAADPRLPVRALELQASTAGSSLVARAAGGVEIYAVRWPVLAGVDGEGLLLVPEGPPRADVVALGDAGWAPEALCGLAGELPEEGRFALHLAQRGCRVVCPVVVDRGRDGTGGIPRREYVWRMAFELGRHIIGYEVQRILALVDFFEFEAETATPIGVMGYGEGGLLALYAAALDPRIAAAVVSGHFRSRAQVWREPIDRDVWGLLRMGCDDAGLAALVAPRGLVVEAATQPRPAGVALGDPDGPPTAEDVWAECQRATRVYGAAHSSRLIVADPGEGRESAPGMPETLDAFLRLLEPAAPPRVRGLPAGPAWDGAGPAEEAAPWAPPGGTPGPLPDAGARRDRQFRQLVDAVQALRRASEAERDRWWSGVDRSSPEAWARGCAHHRATLEEEVIGRCPPPEGPLRARSRLVYDRPGWRGYEVALDLWPEVFASGLLLLPDGAENGPPRPVVVCQHGLEGHARDTVEGPPDSPYRAFAARLAERGFVVFAPQNPYVGGEGFRRLQRKAHPLGLSLFSFITAQHARALEWLGGLPYVDPARIALYGLSYGGKTAMRVPALLPGYCLSICSADFNEWVYKCAAEDRRFGYLYTGEYDMYEWNLGNRCNYAELAGLIAPRPFMVERGHRDGVGRDEFVAFEYAKVRRLYADLGIPESTAIEFFDGGHWIHGEGTFAFLERHLGNPRAEG